VLLMLLTGPKPLLWLLLLLLHVCLQFNCLLLLLFMFLCLLLLLLLFRCLHLPEVFIPCALLAFEQPQLYRWVAEVGVLLGQGHLLETEAVAEQGREG
jgi:hypothetical protein